MLQILKKEKLCKQKKLQNNALHKFHNKICLDICNYLSFISFFLGSSTKVFSTTWTWHWNTGPSLKPSTSGVTLFQNVTWVTGILVVRHSFSLFTVIVTFEATSCIFVLKCFNCSESMLPLPFLFCHHIRWQYNQMQTDMEIAKPWIRKIH